MERESSASGQQGDQPVLVVGGTGMLGHQVVERLIARGKRVRAQVRSTSKTDALKALGVELVVGDLMQADSLPRALEGVDAVVTTAAGYTRFSGRRSSDRVGSRLKLCRGRPEAG